jgi:hypothetical protein
MVTPSQSGFDHHQKRVLDDLKKNLDCWRPSIFDLTLEGGGFFWSTLDFSTMEFASLTLLEKSSLYQLQPPHDSS